MKTSFVQRLIVLAGVLSACQIANALTDPDRCECPAREYFLDYESILLGDRTDWAFVIAGTNPLNLGGTFSHASEVFTDGQMSAVNGRKGECQAPLDGGCYDSGRVDGDTSYSLGSYYCETLDPVTLATMSLNSSFVTYAPGFASGHAVSTCRMVNADGILMFPTDFGYGTSSWRSTAGLCTTERSSYEFSGVDDELRFMVSIAPNIFCFGIEGGVNCDNPADSIDQGLVYNLAIRVIVEYQSGAIDDTFEVSGSLIADGDGNVARTGVFADATWFDWSLAELAAPLVCSADTPSSHDNFPVHCFEEGTTYFEHATQGMQTNPPLSDPGYRTLVFDGSTIEGEVVRVTIERRAWTYLNQLEPEESRCGLCPPCAADFDMSGGVDAGDLSAFLDAYENGDPCTDLDGNGGVDAYDLALFFALFQLGGCD